MGVDINFSDSVDNEFFCLKLMQAFGLPTCHAEIEVFEDQKILVVERFDRKWIKDQLIRLPQEDMCQALGVSPYQKYQSEGGPGIVTIAKLLDISTDVQDKLSFFKAQLVFVSFFAFCVNFVYSQVSIHP